MAATGDLASAQQQQRKLEMFSMVNVQLQKANKK